jgi:membrane associated rhomboid family serine protease
MDWSLALVSQGIAAIIKHEAANGGWHLEVSAQDGQKAFQTLRQYHQENRGWPWHNAIPLTKAHFDWGSLAWAGLLAWMFWLGSVNPDFKRAGIMDTSAVLAGQWWRVFTAIMLHADIAHLAGNLSIGILLFGLAMGRFGTGTGLLASFLAGAAGNLASLLLNAKPFYGLGASGMVMGALGMLSAQTLRWNGESSGSLKQRLAGVAAGIMLFALYGVAPGTDTAAHLGGFVAGLLLGAALVFVPTEFLHRRKTNIVSGFVLLALLAVTWGLALTSGTPH